MEDSQQPDGSERLNEIYEDSTPSDISASRQNSEDDLLPDAPPLSSQESIVDDSSSVDTNDIVCYGMVSVLPVSRYLSVAFSVSHI